MNFFKHKTSFFLVFILLSLFVNGQQTQEYTTKAVLIERLSRFISWPQEKDSIDVFRMLVYGDHLFDNLLDDIYNNVSIKNKEVKIDYASEISDFENYDLIYIGSVSKKKLEDLVEQVADKPILLIGDTDGYVAVGVHINILIIDGVLKFNMNKIRFDESGLLCSYLLFNQAKSVIK